MQTTIGVGDYLIEQILASGVRHVFGVPGDYVLGFFKKMSQSPLQIVNTCDEQGVFPGGSARASM